MYTLTVHQPFASLIVLGFKRWETRPWVTHYKGPLLIHAGAARTVEGHRVFHLPTVHQFLSAHGCHNWDQLPRSAIIGGVTVVETVPTEAFHHSRPLHASEELVGNFPPGYYAFALTKPHAIAPGIPCHGKPGLWSYDHALPAAVA